MAAVGETEGYGEDDGVLQHVGPVRREQDQSPQNTQDKE